MEECLSDEWGGVGWGVLVWEKILPDRGEYISDGVGVFLVWPVKLG